VIFTDVLGVPPISGANKSHVYQDPEVLYRALLKMMKGNKLICDPFMGSGTTARAAISLGLDYIGWEISPQNLMVCNSLVARTQEQGRLAV
jgi:DNA modification methylase